MADELKTVLGFEAKDAIATLATLSKSLNVYTAAMSGAASATGTFNAKAAGIEKNIASLAPASKKAATATQQLSKETGIVQQALLKYGKTVTKIPSTHPLIQKQRDALKELAGQSKKTGKAMILSWESVIRIGFIQVAHQLISKVTSSMGDAGRAAIELENRFAEIQTIGGMLRDDFEGVSESVRGLSDEFGIAAAIVAEGTYQTLSNQVAAAEKSFVFFAAAADFSIAAVTSADAAVSLLSSTINAFGYNANQASVIGGKLFKTIELGRIRGEEFADTFGRVAVLANKLGISLDEVLASIATLTISGLKYNEAFTLITNTMLKLIRPSEALKKVYEELGIVTPEAAVQAYGFLGMLTKIADTTDGTTKELGKLFPRVRALRGILGLTGKAAEKAAENLIKIREASSPELFEAKEIIFKTNAKQIEIELNQLKNAVVFDFGRPALGVINDVIKAMGGLVNLTQTVAAGFGVAASAATLLLIKMHPYIALAVAAGVATTALITLYRKFTKTAIDSIKERVKAEEKAIAQINVKEAELAEDRIKIFDKQLAALQRYTIERQAEMNKHLVLAKQIEQYIKEDFDNQLSNKAKAFDSFVSELENRMEEGKDNINSIQSEIFALQRELSQLDFAGGTAWRDEISQASAMLKRSSTLRYNAQKAFRAGQREQAKSYSDEAKFLAEQAGAIGQSANNSTLVWQAHKLSKNLINDQIGLLKQAGIEEQKATVAAGKQAEIEGTRAKRINALVGMLKDITLFEGKGEIKFGTADEMKAAVRPILIQLQSEFDAAGRKINLFKRLEETGATDLISALKKALVPIQDTLTGEPVELKFAMDRNIDLIFKDIQKHADRPANAIEVRIKEITDLDIRFPDQLAKAQPALVETGKTIDELVRATSGLKGQQEAYDGAVERLPEIFKNIQTELVKTQTIQHDVFDPQFLGPLDVALSEQLPRAYETIRQAAKIAHEQILDFTDPEKFESAIRILSGYEEAMKAAGKIDLAENLRLFITDLKRAADAGEQIKIDVGGKEALDILEQKLKGTNQDFKDMGPAASGAASTIQGAMNSAISSLKATEDQAKRTAAAIAAVGSGGGSTTAHFGKLMYRALGGNVGTDTISAMLSPGEFVVNADSTKKFFSQLVAINSGVKPVYRSEGGPVTNVGDININVNEAVSAKQTARETMGAFRRELRRHTGRI